MLSFGTGLYLFHGLSGKAVKNQRALLDLSFKTCFIYRLKPRARQFQVLPSAKYV